MRWFVLLPSGSSFDFPRRAAAISFAASRSFSAILVDWRGDGDRFPAPRAEAEARGEAFSFGFA
jgi:hypothetical protein